MVRSWPLAAVQASARRRPSRSRTWRLVCRISASLPARRNSLVCREGARRRPCRMADTSANKPSPQAKTGGAAGDAPVHQQAGTRPVEYAAAEHPAEHGSEHQPRGALATPRLVGAVDSTVGAESLAAGHPEAATATLPVSHHLVSMNIDAQASSAGQPSRTRARSIGHGMRSLNRARPHRPHGVGVRKTAMAVDKIRPLRCHTRRAPRAPGQAAARRGPGAERCARRRPSVRPTGPTAQQVPA